jgi:signal transduction histidine kinase
MDRPIGRLGATLQRPAVWLLPLVIAAIQVAGSTGASRHRAAEFGAVPLNAYAYVLLLAGPVLLLARAAYPYAVFLIVLAVTAAYLGAGFGPGPVFLSLVVAFLTAASRGPRWRTYPLPVLGWIAVVWLLPLIRGEPRPPGVAIGAIAAWLLVLVAVAEGIRQRRSVQEARRQRQIAVEREARAEQDRQAAAARLSLARELHDVLAHGLSMINVQSSVALELMDEHPERAGPALAAIKDASRQAIADVHALVAALRTDAAVPTAPTPGIADLDALVGAARATGLTVSTSVAGPTRPVPAVVDVAAARVIQESLTNVVRHSLATSAAVTVTYDRAALTVSVDDDGPPRGTASMSGGSGITGMRERARALGGDLSARRQGHGFSVRARFPLENGSAP